MERSAGDVRNPVSTNIVPWNGRVHTLGWAQQLVMIRTSHSQPPQHIDQQLYSDATSATLSNSTYLALFIVDLVYQLPVFDVLRLQGGGWGGGKCDGSDAAYLTFSATTGKE
jgi:hypothetical protein